METGSERPLPSPDSGLDGIATALTALREHAGLPSYAEIARRIRTLRRERGEVASTPGRVTIYDCFRTGRSRVDIDLVCDIVEALGGGPDLARWRAAHAGVDGGQPGRRTPVRIQTTLPAGTQGLTGRDAELARLVAAGPLVTVVGMPGVGKSALVLEAVRLLAPRFDATLLVNLGGYDDGQPTDPASVVAAMLEHLGARSQDMWRLTLRTRIERMRALAARRRLLVVLDNAAGAAQVAPLLDALAGARVFVTSRSAAAAPPGSPVLTLGPLGQEQALLLLRRLAPQVMPAEADPMALRLVELCGRLPLHLTLTGARMAESPDWTLADQVARLETMPADVIRPALTSSYAALPPDAAELLRLLSLPAADGLPAEAVAALSGRDDSAELVSRLATEHLVQVDASGRVRLHDLVRDYAAQLSADVDPHSARTAAMDRLLRHLEACLAEALGARPGPASHRAEQWLEQHWEVVQRAAVEAGDYGLTGSVARVADLAAPWLDRTGRDTEAEVLHGLVHESTTGLRRAAAALHLAQLMRASSRHQESLDLAEEAIALGGPAGAHDLAGLALLQLGRVAEGHDRLVEGVDRARADGDGRGLARLLNHLAAAEQLLGDYEPAAARLEEAERLALAHGDLETVAEILVNVADDRIRLEQWDDAAHAIRRALRIGDELDLRAGRARNLRILASITMEQGHDAEAEALLSSALAEAERHRSPFFTGEVLLSQARVLSRLGRWEESEAARSAAAGLADELASPWMRTYALIEAGDALMDRGEPERARRRYAEALSTAADLDIASLEALAQVGLGNAYEGLGRLDRAAPHWARARDHLRRVGSPQAERLAARVTAARDADRGRRPTSP